MTGINRTYTSHDATGSAEKIIVEVLNDDLSVTSYKVQARQLDGKTEAQINAALNLWLSENNYLEFIGKVGVHVNRDGSYCLWTGIEPSVFPEDEQVPELP